MVCTVLYAGLFRVGNDSWISRMEHCPLAHKASMIVSSSLTHAQIVLVLLIRRCSVREHHAHHWIVMNRCKFLFPGNVVVLVHQKEFQLIKFIVGVFQLVEFSRYSNWIIVTFCLEISCDDNLLVIDKLLFLRTVKNGLLVHAKNVYVEMVRSYVQ